MSHPLQGVRLKLERAQEHLVFLDNEVTSWLEGEPYSVVGDPGAEGTEYVFKVHVREDPPLVWGTIIGDCLQNMRSALDHLVWQLTLSHTGSPLPANIAGRAGFPIFRDRSQFLGPGERMIRGVYPTAQTIIEQLQPYHGAHPEWDNLWLLNYLARHDRHRVLHTVGAVSEGQSWSVFPAGSATLSELNIGPFKDGTEIARFTVGEANAVVDVDFQPAFSIAFSEGVWDDPIYGSGAILPSPVTDILRDILDLIRTEIVPQFGRFL